MIPNYLDLSYWKKPFKGELINHDFKPSKHQFHSQKSREINKEIPEVQSEIQNNPKKSSILKSKSSLGKNPFIDDEAMDDDDEFDSEDNDLDFSFTMLSETQRLLVQREELFIAKSQNIETLTQDQLNYLKSTKDLVGRPEHQKYKLKYDYDPGVNVFSQAVCEMSEDDDYQMDSFCDDEIVYETDSDIEKSSSKSTNKRHDSNTTPTQPIKRRRIIIESP